ncbi:polysaccharide deacetylase [Amycolatopsis sp. EV170708-02-1]|uniref:polysaccharide deacetylase family protein n=1 Tax=Amycolatopsis sp. EV170708-02-1 TaxID=2919322 RepID=UPI001F0CCC27|nr:polysaccharide deacetylase [Amycolatopsis sp. EV170708-02-1]UMP06751.1 polysaccharide deacetylase [Amycolatopsis sp. EV170708-02-1]
MATEPRLSVCLTFDFDALAVHLGIFGTQDSQSLSRGEFGPFAMPRILKLLADYDIVATFFVPGHTALAYPDVLRRIHDEGHEIGHHGFVHEIPATLDETTERKVFDLGMEALQKTIGVRPRGYRSPGPEFSPHTIDILVENGMVYDATLSGSDFTPYYVRQGDTVSLDSVFQFGAPSSLVAIPFSWDLDDWVHLEFTAEWGPGKPCSAVEEIWRAEFDYAYANVPGGVFDLTMHPQVIGRGSRLEMLRRLIEHMSSRPGVVFESIITYAERWRNAHPLEQWRQEASVHVRERNGGPAIHRED